ncbi:MAG: hypothetical protein Q4F78_00690 [Bacillota bacterium]|nr:hypothetical protein [Bacillota bacterium]
MDKSIGEGTAAVLVYDDSLRGFHASDFKKYLEQEGFEKWYPAHNYDMPWIYVNLNSKVYARGMPGIGMVSPFGKHAVTIEEFKAIYNIYKKYEGLLPLQMETE